MDEKVYPQKMSVVKNWNFGCFRFSMYCSILNISLMLKICQIVYVEYESTYIWANCCRKRWPQLQGVSNAIEPVLM